MGQVAWDDGPKSHLVKKDPDHGGGLILIASPRQRCFGWI